MGERKRKEGVGGERASEELTHFLHWLQSPAVLARSSWPCAPRSPTGIEEILKWLQLCGSCRPHQRDTRHQHCPLIFLRFTAGGKGPARDFRWGQCDCRVTATALAVALSTVVGSLAAGSAAGMSLGTLCMGGMLGPSRVSRIPERRRMESEQGLAGPWLRQRSFPLPAARPSCHLPSTTLW